MSTQLLIYETVVPLTFATHRHSSVEIGRNFDFISKVNSVPLTAIEFREYYDRRVGEIAKISGGRREIRGPVESAPRAPRGR